MTENNSANAITIHLSLTSSPSSPRAPISLPSDGSATASLLRKRASETTNVPLDKLKLIFRGRVITEKEDGDVVKEMKLEDGSVVHVMGKPVNAGGATAGGASTAGGGGVAANNGGSVPAGASLSIPTGSNVAASAAPASSSPLIAALGKLRTSNDGATYRAALTTADKLLGNIVSKPMEEKYRTIKKSNPAFSRRLGAVTGGSDLLLASGFDIETREEGVEYYVLVPDADKWPRLVAAREGIGRALTEAGNTGGGGAGTTTNGAWNGVGAPPAANNGAGMFPGGMPGGGMPPGGGPDMSALQSMMNDPNMMQNALGMMNNPMVQNMMRNDPRFANNPMLQQSLDALRSNPNMLNQVSQMMSDPNMRNQMASMMGGGGAGGGAGAGAADPFAGGPEEMRRQMEQFQRMSQQFGGSAGGFGAPAGGGTATTTGTNPTGRAPASAGGGAAATNPGSGGGGGGNDNEMTEEEMIAEAIARSLRES
eukprot:CAMPEP_0181094456 /NCGR_PEP_ID=MMETSP1071-20121207/10002_1 /TAXON_ID=35127 /ORGANISM="Thalassiosira sp., Strain NH16" /LENGTH=481 /DNA_ID=CAMNT_0023176785 /DNA_START=49 /DNA_END=1494 /DNA_ORIENTATION=-